MLFSERGPVLSLGSSKARAAAAVPVRCGKEECDSYAESTREVETPSSYIVFKRFCHASVLVRLCSVRCPFSPLNFSCSAQWTPKLSCVSTALPTAIPITLSLSIAAYVLTPAAPTLAVALRAARVGVRTTVWLIHGLIFAGVAARPQTSANRCCRSVGYGRWDMRRGLICSLAHLR